MTHPTAQQINLLHHTLGLRPDRREAFRNHFVAGPGHHDQPDLQALVASGLMARSPTPRFLDPSDEVFHVTETGKALALAELPKPPTPPKQHQYLDYLDADGCTGDSFAEHLCGERVPRLEMRHQHAKGGTVWEYRMYRTVFIDRDHPRHRDVQGEWMPTKKAAKATYKTALKAHHKTLAALRSGHSPAGAPA